MPAASAKPFGSEASVRFLSGRSAAGIISTGHWHRPGACRVRASPQRPLPRTSPALPAGRQSAPGDGMLPACSTWCGACPCLALAQANACSLPRLKLARAMTGHTLAPPSKSPSVAQAAFGKPCKSLSVAGIAAVHLAAECAEDDWHEGIRLFLIVCSIRPSGAFSSSHPFTRPVPAGRAGISTCWCHHPCFHLSKLPP